MAGGQKRRPASAMRRPAAAASASEPSRKRWASGILGLKASPKRHVPTKRSQNALPTDIFANMWDIAGSRDKNLACDIANTLATIKTLRIGSMCSGSNITTVMMQRLAETMGEGKIADVFTCEADDRKRGWLKFINEFYGYKTKQGCGHIFKNVMDMCGQEAQCDACGRKCSISKLKPHITTCGFSCKLKPHITSETSQMSTDAMLIDIVRESKASSRLNLKGMLGYLRSHKPFIHIWETVPEIMDAPQADDLEYLIGALAELNYACAEGRFLSNDYQIPQRRFRGEMVWQWI